MRGKEVSYSPRTLVLGITPAYAGKRRFLSCTTTIFWDHPRLCGEKSRYSVTLWITAGSPPPMRGKVTGVFQHVQFVRITPAYAGKSGTSN